MNPKTQYIRNAITFLEESTPVMADYALMELNALEAEHAALVAVAEAAKVINKRGCKAPTIKQSLDLDDALKALEPAKDEAKEEWAKQNPFPKGRYNTL